MKTSNDLRELLTRIDHKGYPAYKDTRGSYQFEGYVLSIDHVQGDPFAAPSKVSIHVPGKTAGFPSDLYEEKHKRIALQDYLLRKLWEKFGKDIKNIVDDAVNSQDFNQLNKAITNTVNEAVSTLQKSLKTAGDKFMIAIPNPALNVYPHIVNTNPPAFREVFFLKSSGFVSPPCSLKKSCPYCFF